MDRLGYERFAAQGGDWGAAVTNYLGQAHSDRVTGIHVNMPLAPVGPLTDDATDFERQSYEENKWHQRWGSAYQQQQATRPQTLGYGLVDSPAGQLAWIVEKFWAWTDCEGDPYTIFTPEQLLDNVTIYWLTATGPSSGRLYWESASTDPGLVAKISGPGHGPDGVLRLSPPRSAGPHAGGRSRCTPNLHYWNHPRARRPLRRLRAAGPVRRGGTRPRFGPSGSPATATTRRSRFRRSACCRWTSQVLRS